MSPNGAHDDDRSSASRRRFIAASGATGVAAGLAGCADLLWGGTGGSEAGNGTGTTTGTTREEATTIRWGFDPTATQENGDAITTALHEQGGLADNVTVELVPGDSDTAPGGRTTLAC